MTGAEELGCARKPIWDSGFQSVLRFCHRLLEVPQTAQRCTQVQSPRGPAWKNIVVNNSLCISLHAPYEFFLSGDREKIFSFTYLELFHVH